MSKKTRGGFVIGLILAIITCTKSYGQLNFPPTATNDVASTPENTAVVINVLANDTDENNNINASTVDLDVASPGVQDSFTTTGGVYIVDITGAVTFTPVSEFNGTVQIAYTVNDSTELTSNAADIVVEVVGANIPPVAVDDEASTSEDKEVEISILVNDSDSDGELDTSKVDMNVAQAGVQKTFMAPEGEWRANNGKVKFKPKKDFVGTATNKYVVYDDAGDPSNQATITVSVVGNNAAPVAKDDTGGTTLNTSTTVNVVANDTDADGTIDATKVDLNTATAGVQNSANTAQGSWAVNAAGVVTYTPIAAFVGSASLNYTVMDNEGDVSNVAKITITVQVLNVPPIAVNDNVTTTKNKPVNINATANDTDLDGGIDLTKVDLNTTLAGVQNMVLTDQGQFTANPQGIVTYTPAVNFTGIAAINYTVTDKVGAISNAATITITVQNVNSPPVAADDTGATSANTQTTVNVVENDTDSDGVVDAAKVDLNPAVAGIQSTYAVLLQGSFSVSNIGIVTFTPSLLFTGSISINYTVMDNNGAVSNIAKITIAVQPLNAPVANADEATTNANTAVDINVVGNDKDSDGTIDPTTVDLNVVTAGVQKTNNAVEGSYSVNETGVVTFSPKLNFVGTAVLQYNVKDNKGVMSNNATITIEVIAVPNIAPEIVAFEDETDTLRYTPGNPIAVTDLFEVEDGDDESLTIAEIGFSDGFYTTGKDKLSYGDTQLIKGSFDIQTGVLKLTGPAPIDRFIDAVRAVRYEYASADELKANIKKIYVRVSDGKEFSKLKQRLIKVNSAVSDLDIPTAFTPNSDGANDTWRILAPTSISGSDFADAEIRVYDKRGTVVFGASGLGSAWDGTFQGKQLPVDTYYYTIDIKQQQKRYKGIVAILR